MSEAANIKWTRHPIVDVLIPPLAVAELQGWLTRPGGYEAALQYWSRHEQAIKDAEADPLRRGFELEFWKDARALLGRKNEVYALGGNGPGKTELGGKIACETLCAEPGRKVLCVATNENSSKQLQQPAVYKYLPAGLRGKNEQPLPQKRHSVTKVKYTPAGGFTEGTFVLPNRSQTWFKTVRQYLDDPLSFEGPEYDLVWIDEPAPVALLNTLKYRVSKRRGKIFLTFTAVHGFDAVCQQVLTGARLVQSLPMNWVWRIGEVQSPESEVQSREGASKAGLAGTLALPSARLPVGRGSPDKRVVIPELRLEEEQVRGCPQGHMPYIMQPLDPAQGVIFLWTHWNVFLPRYRSDPQDPKSENPHIPALFATTRGKAPGAVRTRLFGWAEKLSGCQYPQFRPEVHVVPLSHVPAEVTVYMAGDPATARSYFLLWVAVDRRGRKFVFDESPRLTEGEWVNEEGERGEGQRLYAGRGSKWYKGYIRAREREHEREMEKGQSAEVRGQRSDFSLREERGPWTPLRRKGDPRAFATAAAARDGGESLFELYRHDDASAEQPDAGPMEWEPAKVRATMDLDLEKVNDELDYDEKRPVNAENEPSLYIVERCQNLIRCMLNWSPEQGSDSPWKDPNDTLRYLFDEPLCYVDPQVPEIVGGRGW